MASTELHAVMETVLLVYSHAVHTVKEEYAVHLIQIQWRMFTLKRRKIIERFTGNRRRVLKVISILNFQNNFFGVQHCSMTFMILLLLRLV